jgi:hypothetical protein
VCVRARAVQLLVERACRIARPEIAQRYTAIGQQGDWRTENLGRDPWQEPDPPLRRSRLGPRKVGRWYRDRRSMVVGPALRQDRRNHQEERRGLSPGGAGPYARNPVA